MEFSQVGINETPKAQDRDAEQQLEFHKLLQNSNSDMARERSAKKTGDLSAAKTDEEFRKMLSEKANPKRTPKNALGKDDFMKLFIAQLQSQDPLNPQDSAQMASQMAQFNGLEQMMNVNKTLETMLQSQTNDRTISMVNYVGKEVDVGTGMLKWDKNKMTKSTFEVEQPLSNAFIEVRDGSGQVIGSKELGNLMPGEHNLKWDGTLKSGQVATPGLYHFSVVGKSADGQDVPISIKSKVKITGVDLQAPGGAFFTELGKLAVKDIASVGIQGFDENKVMAPSAPPPSPSQGAPNSSTSEQPSSDKNPQAAILGQPAQSQIEKNSVTGDASSEPLGWDNSNDPVLGKPKETLGSANGDSEAPPPNISEMNIPVTFAGR
jgi:flagellar basal-body rod modification protein FlgD